MVKIDNSRFLWIKVVGVSSKNGPIGLKLNRIYYIITFSPLNALAPIATGDRGAEQLTLSNFFQHTNNPHPRVTYLKFGWLHRHFNWNITEVDTSDVWPKLQRMYTKFSNVRSEKLQRSIRPKPWVYLARDYFFFFSILE